MTITISLPGLDTTPADVAVGQIDQSDLSLVATDENTVAGSVTARYKIFADDAIHQTVVTMSAQLDPRAKIQRRRIVTQVDTWLKASNSVSGLDSFSPVSIVRTIILPNDIPATAALLRDLEDTLYGLSFTTLTSKVPDNDVLLALLNGKADAL